jgi:AraC-like DNA-binding protein
MVRDEAGVGDRATFRVIHELGPIETISAVFTRQRFRPHYHETFLIGVTESGAEVFDARGARHVSPAGSLRFFNPGEVHTGEPPPEGEWAYRCLYPPVALLADIARELGRIEPVWFPDMVVPDEQLAGELVGALGSLDRPGSRLERSTRLRLVLAGIVSRHAGGRPDSAPSRLHEPRAVAAAVAYIRDRAADDFSLDDLAGAVGMSPYHLLRVFKARAGLTPFAYQTQLRIEAARRMLAAGGGIGRTAEACGFVDRSHLARVFRGFVGVSPGAYRRAFAEEFGRWERSRPPGDRKRE